MGTCNFPDRIDAAVLRLSRFDLKVEVLLPGAQGNRAIGTACGHAIVGTALGVGKLRG